MQFPFSFWGGFTPYFVPGLRAWYNAESLQALGTGYQAAVSSWPELVSGWTATQATGTNQPRFLPHGGGEANNYLRLPAIAGNYGSTPDSAALDITGDIDVAADILSTDYTPSSARVIIAKGTSVVPANLSYMLQNDTAGTLTLYWSTGAATLSATSTAAVPFSDGARGSVRATLDVDNGAGGHTVTFYTGSAFGTWTQLGLAVIAAGTTSIQNSSNAGAVGSFTGGSSGVFSGGIYRVQIKNGINGTLAADFDASRGNGNSSSIVAATGETWTINRTGVDPAMIVSAPRILWVTDDFMELPSASYGVAQNVGGITMFAVMAPSSLSVEINSVSISTNTVSLRAGLAATTAPAFRVGGRRTDADSFGSVSSFTPVVNTSVVHAGVLDYANATARVFVNGTGGTAGAFQTPGNTSNTASISSRIGASTASTPVNFMNGTLSQVLIYNRALTATEILNVSKYLASRTGGAIVI